MPIPRQFTLRIVIAAEYSGLTFTLELFEPGHPALNATGRFISQLPKDLLTELQWYLEKFLDERDDALVRAKRIRESIKFSGQRLFQDVFQSNAECRAIWRRIAPRLSHTKIEIFESGLQARSAKSQSRDQAAKPMKNELAMTLFSRRSLTESVAKEQITALSDFGGGLMRPDKCSEVEPIRTPFDPADISEPVRWLSQPHGEFFYRKGRPVHVSGQIWNRTHSATARFPSPLFSNYWTGQFDGKWATQVGIEKVEDFVCGMFQITGSDFGLLTTEVDQKAKNTDATSYSYQGLNLADGVPGLYWVNLFSDKLAGWLGLSEFPKELAVSKRLPGGGVSLKFCDSPEHCRDIDILQKQRAAIEWLGAQRFFDIRFPDRKLDTPDWDHIAPRGLESVG